MGFLQKKLNKFIVPKHFVYLQSAQRKSAYVKVYAFVLKQFTENPEEVPVSTKDNNLNWQNEIKMKLMLKIYG